MTDMTIGLLTSGGDAPGMNAAIRSVTRSAIARGFRVIGIRRGYQGLLDGDMVELGAREVSDILHRGGTMLRTARSKEFATPDGVLKAKEKLAAAKIDALVVIGGDGTYRGALDLSRVGVKCIGLPGTIDNDIVCTEYTIGFDTAQNTALEMLDKLKDTEMSHNRCSVVEVMGRNAPHIGVRVAAATGAIDCIIRPDSPDPEERVRMVKEKVSEICEKITEQKSAGKSHFELIVCEGAVEDGYTSDDIAKDIESVTKVTSRATVLGHVQRGGSPTCYDRVMALKMGYYAVELLANGYSNRIVASKNDKLVDYGIEEALKMQKGYDEKLHSVLKILSI